jgi:hypothetical protein
LIFSSKDSIGIFNPLHSFRSYSQCLSISATFLRNNVAATLRRHFEEPGIGIAQYIGHNFIYSYPVLKDMAEAIFTLLRPEVSNEALDPVASVCAMIQRYTQDMAAVRPSNQLKPSQDVVLLTGSTGGLGSQLLVGLLADSKVAKVITLNRSSTQSSLLERHKAVFSDRGLDVALLKSPKLILLEGEVSSEHLGLSPGQYEEVRSSV